MSGRWWVRCSIKGVRGQLLGKYLHQRHTQARYPGLYASEPTRGSDLASKSKCNYKHICKCNPSAVICKLWECIWSLIVETDCWLSTKQAGSLTHFLKSGGTLSKAHPALKLILLRIIFLKTFLACDLLNKLCISMLYLCIRPPSCRWCWSVTIWSVDYTTPSYTEHLLHTFPHIQNTTASYTCALHLPTQYKLPTHPGSGKHYIFTSLHTTIPPWPACS